MPPAVPSDKVGSDGSSTMRPARTDWAMTFDAACNLLLNYETAYFALVTRARLQAGETVVVQGQYRLTPGTLIVSAPPSGAPNPTTASAGMLP